MERSRRRARSVPLGLEASNPFWSEAGRAEGSKTYGGYRGPRPMSHAELRGMVPVFRRCLGRLADGSTRNMGQMPKEMHMTEGPAPEHGADAGQGRPERSGHKEKKADELVQSLLEHNAAMQDQIDQMMAERAAKEKSKRRKRSTGGKCITMVSCDGIGGKADAYYTPQRPRVRSVRCKDEEKDTRGDASSFGVASRKSGHLLTLLQWASWTMHESDSDGCEERSQW